MKHRATASGGPIWIGVDMGGTRIKAGALDARRKEIGRFVVATNPNQSVRALEKQLNTVIDRVKTAAGGTLAGIGVALTGPVDPNVGCIRLPGKIRGLDRHTTVPRLGRRWNVPVTADNDGRLACYAEWKMGAGQGIENLVVLTLGTGIGSGVVLDGRLLGDAHFQRGTQCGHFIIDLHGPRCLTGASGTGESVASITALVEEVRAHVARGVALELPVRLRNDIGFPEIATAVRKGGPLITGVFDRWLDRFSVVLLNAFYAYTPDLIVLSGGPTRASDIFVRKLETRLNAAAFRVPEKYPIPIAIARLGDAAGWIGAALRNREITGLDA